MAAKRATRIDEMTEKNVNNEDLESVAIVEYKVNGKMQYLTYSAETGKVEEITPEDLKKAIITGKIKGTDKLKTGIIARLKKENDIDSLEDSQKEI